MTTAPVPTEIKLKRRTRVLEVGFSDGSRFDLPAEYLRVFSPSAEVQGHGGGEGALVTGKESVNISSIEPVGRYAVRLIFDDGHDTGLYTWPILYDLGKDYETKWRRYLTRLEEAGQPRAAADLNDGPEQ
ncbi:MAG: gamma-butyrobetaine hydroxylase-like domain-containing protein [Candidatus Rariloculaceae bacterium]